MDTATAIYTPRPDLIVQRSMAFFGYDSIAAALANADFDAGPDDDAAMLVSDHGQLFELNLAGAFVWEHMDGKRSIVDVADRVAEAFDVPPDKARRDIEVLLEEYERLGLVRRAE